MAHPARLAQCSYEALDQLILAYPYFVLPRLWYLKKMQQDKHPQFEEQLALTATYCPDRAFLHRFLKQSTPVVTFRKRMK